MFEDLIQDLEVVKDLTRLNRKQSCGIGSSGGGVSSADLGALPDDLEHLQNEQLCFGGKVSGDDQGTRTEDSAEASDAVGARRGSPVTCCCGDNRGFNVRDTQKDDMTGIVVANGGRFPCLHIGVTGLRPNHRYFLALDFVEVGGVVDAFSLPDLTEPYYTPRPNNLQGYQWTSGVLYFNLNSIANGGLQESGMTLKVGGEYEPTFRLLELRDDQWPSGSSAVRFALPGTAFLVVSLNSEVRMNRAALASEFLLVRKSEMSRSRFPTQHPPPPQQQECCRSPPTRIFPPEPAGGVAPALQSEWRRLLELRAGGHPAAAAAAAAAATRLLRAAGPSSHGLQALPAASEPLAPTGTASALRPVYAKSVVHDHFSGGVWKSLPSQPQQSHPQPQPQQQQPPQPVGAGAWHSSSARHHSCSAPGAHLELGALLHRVQQNREALSSLVQHSGSSQARPPTSLSDFGGRPGGVLQLSAESRPSTSLAPFGGAAAAAAATAHALQECWSRGSPPSGPPLLRFNYDLLPPGYLHWLALARSNLARPQAMAAAFDHAQQLKQQQQSKQDMGVQTTCSTTPSSLEEEDSNASDALGAAAFATPHSGVFFASSSSLASSP